MRKIFNLIIALSMVVGAMAQTSKTITVASPGSLSTLLTTEETGLLTSLTLKGSINASDIEFIQQMTALESLDMKAVALSGNAIAEGAFNYNKTIKEIVFPAKVQTIGNDAFRSCTSLRTISLPDSLRNLGSTAFIYCSALDSVIIPAGVSVLKSNAFARCESLSHVVLPPNLKKIETDAFDGCSNLSSIVFPETITSIGNGAFSSTGLSSVNLPKSVISLGNSVFYNCPNLTSVSIQNPSCTLGTSVFYSCENLLSINIPDSLSAIPSGLLQGCSSLTELSIPKKVVSIGNNAFNGCKSLLSITLPEGVASIGSNAFYYCSGLTKMVIPQGISVVKSYTFYGCSSLQEVQLPKGLKVIEGNAFDECTNLRSISIPAGVTSLGGSAFSNSGLLTVQVPSSVKSVGNSCFSGCDELTNIYFANPSVSLGTDVLYSCENLVSVHLPDSLVSIPDDMFWGCKSLASVNVPATVKSVGNNAFHGCSSLTAIDLPSEINYMGSSCFNNCTNLQNITIPDSISVIKDYSFNNCQALRSVQLPEGLLVIEDGAFSYCENLSSVLLPSKLTTLDESVFSNSGLTSVSIPKSVSKIGAGCFSSCDKMVSATFACTKPYIGQSLFYSCSILISVKLPDSLTTITKDCFWYCNNLYSIIIPATVTSIGNNAFRNCTKLSSITAHNPVPVNLRANQYAFDGVNKTSCKLNVPAGSEAAYKEAEIWKEFFGIAPTPAISVSDTTIKMGKVASSETVMVRSTKAYVLTSNQSWISVTPSSGTGDQTITLSANDNYTGKVRVALVVLLAEEEAPVTITITQIYDTLSQTPDSVSITRTLPDTSITLSNAGKKIDLLQYFGTNASQLDYHISTSNPEVAYAAATGNALGFVPYNTGRTTISITATTPRGSSATMRFVVTVTINDCGLNVEGDISHPSCHGSSDGRIVVRLSGGTPPYTYRWTTTRSDKQLINVMEGTYTVIVSDSNACVSTKTFVLKAPSAITTQVSVSKPTCQKTDGSIELFTSGGQEPYEYSWGTGNTSSLLSDIGTGIYPVTITDSKNCKTRESIAVDEEGAPQISIDSIVESSCRVNNGKIIVSIGGGSAPFTFSWNDGADSRNRLAVGPGTYQLTVTNSIKCQAIRSITVPSPSIRQPSIALVTVGDESGKNVVVWLKERTLAIKHYTIYSENNLSGEFVETGIVPYASRSYFVDKASNPEIQSLRYKISATDYCDKETDLSTEFKTIHVTSKALNNNAFVLNWDSYEGTDVFTYALLRYTKNGGEEEIARRPASISRYVDMAPPADVVGYRVAVELAKTIDTTDLKSDGGPYSYSISNMAESQLPDETSINPMNELLDPRIFPNPCGNSVQIQVSKLKGPTSYRLLNAMGCVIGNGELTEGENIVHINAPMGLYVIELLNEDGLYIHKVLKSNE